MCNPKKLFELRLELKMLYKRTLYKRNTFYLIEHSKKFL